MRNTNTFEPFAKIARLSRECVITEKIDGTNAQIYIPEYLNAENAGIPFFTVPRPDGGADWIAAGSRNRWITPEDDNYGFAKWVKENSYELLALGPGRHFGEWWGAGIQRQYGLTEKRFSLFNMGRWATKDNATYLNDEQDPCPACCHIVPVLYRGDFDTAKIQATLTLLGATGSQAAPGFNNPEGIVIYHTASKTIFKKTIKDDASPKSLVGGDWTPSEQPYGN